MQRAIQRVARQKMYPPCLAYPTQLHRSFIHSFFSTKEKRISTLLPDGITRHISAILIRNPPRSGGYEQAKSDEFYHNRLEE